MGNKLTIHLTINLLKWLMQHISTGHESNWSRQLHERFSFFTIINLLHENKKSLIIFIIRVKMSTFSQLVVISRQLKEI